MRYRNIVFLQGDEAVEMLMFLDECGEEQTLDRLACLDDGTGEVSDESRSGEADLVREDGRYRLSANTHLDYIGLEALVP